MNGWLAILFMWSCVFVSFSLPARLAVPLQHERLPFLLVFLSASQVGFSYASFARRFLIEDPKIVFPLTLQQVAVFKSMRDSFEFDSATNKRQMRVFWYGILAVFIWQL